MSQTGVQAEVRICTDAEDMAAKVAEVIVRQATCCAGQMGRFTLALSGGRTPETLFEVLARDFAMKLPWQKTHFFWGDDRFVPHEDPRSNYRLAKQVLFDHVPCPAGNVHPMPIFFKDPEDAAADYEATLKGYFPGPWPRFDIALLGMGDNGHVASLFPHSPALREHSRWVVAVREEEAEPPLRLTLTLPALNQAAQVHFLVTGEEKAEKVAEALSPQADVQECPAAGVRPERGELVWWLDEAAAAKL
ncbi:MAG: 6-phosphogluconolactonase [Armatimonadia bacterium]